MNDAGAGPLAVAVVEDNPDLRAALAVLLDSDPRFRCAGTFDRAEPFLDACAGLAMDAVTMDIGLPGIDGVECVRRLRAVREGVPAVMLTVYDDDDRIFAALCAGAAGYVLKESPPQAILASIADTCAGGASMSPRVAQRVLRMFAARFAPPTPGTDLSARERDVLEKLVRGASYKEIAAELFISAHTVNSHLKSIYGKLRVHSKSAAVAKALREGLV